MNVIAYGVNKSFLKGRPSVTTVYVTSAAMSMPKMLNIVLPTVTKEHFLSGKLSCLKKEMYNQF
jgi:hypothetical protein